jgi:hypothetical protein
MAYLHERWSEVMAKERLCCFQKRGGKDKEMSRLKRYLRQKLASATKSIDDH